jgi:hypothetical protein
MLKKKRNLNSFETLMEIILFEKINKKLKIKILKKLKKEM